MSQWIHGIHPVLEVLRAGRRQVRRVVVAAGRRDARIGEVLDAAARAGLEVERRSSSVLDRLAGDRVSHQGALALVDHSITVPPDSILENATSPPLLVVMDGVEDPRNLGAVIRSAAAAGSDGLFLPERRSSGLTPVCLKAAAGAAEKLPIAHVGNIVQFLKLLKNKGIWVVGLDARGTMPWSRFDFKVGVALVLGAEGKGLRRLARETCDALISIPLRSGVESLNMSVAAGVVLFEAIRQRTSEAE